jgi:hypothetical protein
MPSNLDASGDSLDENEYSREFLHAMIKLERFA